MPVRASRSAIEFAISGSKKQRLGGMRSGGKPPKKGTEPGAQHRRIGRSTPGSTAAMAVLASNSSNVCHVPPVPAHGQPALARDFSLLFRAHGRKPSSTLFLTASLRLGGYGSTRGLSTFRSSAGLSASAGASAWRGGSASRLLLLLGLRFHGTPGASGASACRGLPLWFLRLNAVHREILLDVRIAGAVARLGVGFGNRDRSLSAVTHG